MNPRVNLSSFSKSIAGAETKFFDKMEEETSYGQKPGLNEIGRISVGELAPTQNGGTRPAGIDYFRIRTRHRMVEKSILDNYGEKPSTLPIFFNTSDFNNHCFEQLVLRDGAGKKFAYSDGETFFCWNKKTASYVERHIDNDPEIASKILKLCRESSNKSGGADWAHEITLRFCIKDVGVLGYWQFTSKGSKTTIPALRNVIDQCFQVFGFFEFLPFQMSVTMAQGNKPGENRKYPVVNITPAFSFEKGMQLAQFVQENPDFRTANFALMDFAKPGDQKLLLISNNNQDASQTQG